MERRAKIVATLGPASASEEVLRELLRAGVNLVRLNLSHGTHEEHLRAMELVRRVAQEERFHVALVLDLMGPRYRLGTISGGRTLEPGEEVRLGAAAPGVELPLDDPDILQHLNPGERVLIDSGLIELTVESKEGDRATARVVNGGEVKTRKGINLPDSSLPFEISDKDRADIAFAVAHGADFLAASYVGQGSHVEALRRIVREAGGDIPIIAKLERATALEHLDEIVAAADGLMVARGDLGVEVPLHTVPVWQKKIIDAGRRAGEPVIVATQMLESMIEQPRPTRAEATDVATAVFDGADALMLSGETAVGRYPVEAVATMARIIVEAEAYQRGKGERPSLAPLPFGRQDDALDVPDMVSAAAVYAAGQLGVRCVAAFSQSGFTARLVARYRPLAPIVAFTREARVARRMQLIWGVRPLLAASDVEHLDGLVQFVDGRLQLAGLAAPGERIIILMGHPIREHPRTNLMRVHRVRSAEQWRSSAPREAPPA